MTPAAEDDIVLKVLHTADWHLGLRFSRFASEAAQPRLSRARLEVVERILLAAERHAVHAVLCAGDLFDTPNPTREWCDGLVECFQRRRWSERRVFLLPGNHDPLLADSVWRSDQFRRALPDFVVVIDRADFEVALTPEAVLYAVPCLSKAGQRDPTESIPVRAEGDERVRIGMVHGSTFDARDFQTNFPIDRDAVLKRGLDYLAIGDTHGFRFVPPDRKHPPTIYPGSPEPTAFDEVDAGCMAVVLFNRQRRAIVQQERVAHWTWEDLRIESLQDLRSLVQRSDLANRVVRLRVDMRLSAPEYEEAERLLLVLEGSDARPGRAGVLHLEREKLQLDATTFEQYSSELPAVLQAAVAELTLAAKDPSQREVAERALYLLYHTSRKAG